MKIQKSLFVFIFFLAINIILENNCHARTRTLLSKSWTFSQENLKDSELSEYNDTNWKKINLPHTWNAEDAFDDTPGYRQGIGWYRKVFNVDKKSQDKKFYLYFEGANQVTEVFINGHQVGKHIGGYTAFAFDISNYIQLHKKNILAVKVDNSSDPMIPPLSADFTFYGGIYRDVWLIATDPIHFDLLDNASSGIYLETPQVGKDKATVKIKGAIKNDSALARNLKIRTIISNAKGLPVESISTSLVSRPNQVTFFEQDPTPLKNPELWSPDSPYLYTVTTQIYNGKKLLDEIKNPLGLRYFRFDPEKGFELNGFPLRLRGANKHQDYAGLGNAVDQKLLIEDMVLLKKMGSNFVRLAHYPQTQDVLDAADRLGLIIWEEIPVVNTINPALEFTENSLNMLVEMIRQHYNHPSIVMWGAMNEILLFPKTEEAYVEKVVELARTLNERVKKEDPSRIRVMAVHGSDVYNTSGLADIPQVLGWNLYQGWYGGTFEDFGKFLDDQHKRFPLRPILISEYGADGDERLHSYRPERFDYTMEWMRLYHESYFAQLEERPFVAGSAVWAGFDFGSEKRGESKPHYNQKGLWNANRTPKDIFYFYKAKLSSDPVLRIVSHDWTARVGNPPVNEKVEIYSNLKEVELFLNGDSLGKKLIDSSRKEFWDVPFKNGLNKLEARAMTAAGPIVDHLEIHFKYLPSSLSNATIPFEEIAIKVGSFAQFIDSSGLIWQADQEYKTGAWGYRGGEASKTPNNILTTEDDPLYQTAREGLSDYSFDVPDGDYEIDFRFSEPRLDQAKQRVFTILLNGSPLIKDIDLFKMGGKDTPVIMKVRGSAFRQQGLHFKFVASQGSTLLSGIHLRLIK